MHPIHGINRGNKVLDYGTGTGYLAIQAAMLGAKVVAIDINHHAVACAKYNIKQNNVKELIDVRRSDAFSSIKAEEIFDVILAGIPWENAKPNNWLERAFYDENFKMRRTLFKEAKKHLTEDGCIFFSYSKHVQELAPIEDFIDGYEYFVIAEKEIQIEPHYIYKIKQKRHDNIYV